MPEMLSEEEINRLLEHHDQEKEEPKAEEAKKPEDNASAEAAPEPEAAAEKPVAAADYEKRAQAIIRNVGQGKYDRLAEVPEGMKETLRQYNVPEDDIAAKSVDELAHILQNRMDEKAVAQKAEEAAKKPETETKPEAEPLKTAAEITVGEKLAEKPAEAEPEPQTEGLTDAQKEKQLEKSPEMAEVKKEIDAMSREEKMGLARGFKSVGLYAMKGKSELFANALEKAGGDQKSETTWAHFMAGLAKTYRRDAAEADKKLDDAKRGKTHGLVSSFYIGGNTVKYGRIVGDVIGWTAAMPLRYAMLGSATFARLAEGTKEGRFENKELIDKTRIQDADAAAAEAWKIYEEAKAANGGQPVKSEDLQAAYAKELPADLMERLKKPTLTEKVGVANRIVQNIAKWNIERSAEKIQTKLDEVQSDKNLSKSQKAAEQKKIMAKYERRLKDWDRAVGQYGTVDAIAMGARYAELAGKTAVLAMGAETVIYGAIHGISELLSKSDLSHAAETAAIPHGATPHEAAQHAAEAIPRGESIPPPAYEINANYTQTIGEHGNVWEAAKSIGLNHKEFVDAWASQESVIHTAQGSIQIHDLNMVHPGDVVKFFPGGKGMPGHFEVFAKSGQPMGTGLPIEHIGKVEPMPMTSGHPIEDAIREGKLNTLGGSHTPAAPEHIGPLADHPAGNPIWENQPAPSPEHGATVIGHTQTGPLAPEHAAAIPEHPGLPHEATGSVEIHPGGLETNLDIKGYTGAEYMAKDYRNDVLSYALAHHLDMQMEMDKFQIFGQKLAGNIKLFEQLHANPAKANEASALLESIKNAISQAEKTYGSGVIDKTKLPDFLK